MSRKKVFKTAEEAVEYLFSEELESEMIVLPPEVEEFTDEEGFDDSETLDPSIRDRISLNELLCFRRTQSEIAGKDYPPPIQDRAWVVRVKTTQVEGQTISHEGTKRRDSTLVR
ncbi:hypothetical protein NPIL_88251 [Nephila pilipes]|uniref:Uncharacterized protein n=1 Tax=Nephila pilipes TaxID=299642 RepID=A0A8X6Q3M8_NEPPI|nr:hypothetical protein NPIL_88251 [Nephila pilipes]